MHYALLLLLLNLFLCIHGGRAAAEEPIPNTRTLLLLRLVGWIGRAQVAVTASAPDVPTVALDAEGKIPSVDADLSFPSSSEGLKGPEIPSIGGGASAGVDVPSASLDVSGESRRMMCSARW